MSFNKLEYASLPCVVRKSWSYKTRKWSLNLHPWNSLLKIRPQIAFSCLVKRPSHVKLLLAGSCWRAQVGVCERHNNMLANCWWQIELVSILVNFSPTSCVVHTHQFEFAGTSWPTLVWRVKAALDVVLNSCYSRVYLTQISSKCNLWLSVASLVTLTFVTASAGLVDLAGKKYTFQTRPKSLSFFGSKKVIK